MSGELVQSILGFVVCLTWMAGLIMGQPAATGAPAAAATEEATALPPGVRVHRDLVYAAVDGRELGLDLYMPAGVADPLLVVWVHGGAWREGSKADPPLGFVESGLALASVDYRLSGEARFPALVHDIKAAIRYLRAEAGKYGYQRERIAIAGNSAGGHLAALVGVTAGVAELEGTVGEHPEQSSAVQAIVDYYGPTNFETILKQSTPHGLSVREPAFEQLLGGLPGSGPEPARLAHLASPVFHVDAADPPLLMIHGDQDPQVPINQSHELHGVYKQHGLPAHLEVIHGGLHGGDAFYDREHMALAVDFIRRSLAGAR